MTTDGEIQHQFLRPLEVLISRPHRRQRPVSDRNFEEHGREREISVKKSDTSDTSDRSDRSDYKAWRLTREMTYIDDLPQKVENAVKERIGRLEKHLREILDYASVEGDDFIAQVIAKIGSLRNGN